MINREEPRKPRKTRKTRKNRKGLSWFSKEKAKRILDQAMERSKADETEATLYGNASALTRFAENAIHQNVEERTATLTVRAIVGKRIGQATTNRLDETSIAKVVEDAVELARFAPEDKELLPRLGPQTYRTIQAYYENTSTQAFGPDQRAVAVAEVVEAARTMGLSAAGAFSNGSGSYAVANSNGLFAYYQGSEAAFNVTATGEDSSGWTEQRSHDVTQIHPDKQGCIAMEKALASAHPKEVPPGVYTVVLEPPAVASLVEWLVLSYNALAVDEGRSFLSGKVGTQIAGENIYLYSDPYHPFHQGTPFDGEGTPSKRLTLIEAGVAKDLAFDRVTARKHGVEPTGHASGGRSAEGAWPSYLVLEGGTASNEEMIRSTERGILVTRFWYENLVDPMKMIVTGMTRDGLFWIEDGEVRYGLKNFRFNQSVPDLLNHVDMMSTPVLAGEMVAPAMKVTAFHFSSGTAF